MQKHEDALVSVVENQMNHTKVSPAMQECARVITSGFGLLFPSHLLIEH